MLGILYNVKKKVCLKGRPHLLSSCMYHEYWLSDSCHLFKGTNEFLPLLSILLDQFGVNRYSESHSLLKGIHEILSTFSIFFIRFGNNSVQDVSTKANCVIVSYVQIDAMKVVLYTGA
jgi:hypothetical protein